MEGSNKKTGGFLFGTGGFTIVGGGFFLIGSQQQKKSDALQMEDFFVFLGATHNGTQLGWVGSLLQFVKLGDSI